MAGPALGAVVCLNCVRKGSLCDQRSWSGIFEWAVRIRGFHPAVGLLLGRHRLVVDVAISGAPEADIRKRDAASELRAIAVPRVQASRKLAVRFLLESSEHDSAFIEPH